MQVLHDECVPQRLSRDLPGHDVRTVREMGWSGKKNGELLRLMVAQGFEVLITVDQNLRYQQNLRSVGIAVVVLIAAGNHLDSLRLLMPSVRTALESIAAGDIVEITA